MKAKLKRIHSPDVDLESFWPEDSKNFGFLLQAMIGPDDQEGDESFDMEVCTPDWLKSHHAAEDVLFGRHLLIVFEYDLDRIKAHIAKYCERCVGDDWVVIANQLSKIGHWEFEDYAAYEKNENGKAHV